MNLLSKHKILVCMVSAILLLSMVSGCGEVVGREVPTSAVAPNTFITVQNTTDIPSPSCPVLPSASPEASAIPSEPPSETPAIPTAAVAPPAASSQASAFSASTAVPATPDLSVEKAVVTDNVSSLITKITVTFYGDDASARGFTWYTDGNSASSDVQIVEKTSTAPDFSNAITFAGAVSASHNSPGELVHKAVATGLNTGTTYYYRVGDASLNIWSATGTFTTASLNGPFTFIDVSDTQFAGKAGAQVVANTLSSAMTHSPNAAFIINNGDIVDNKTEDQWNLLLKYTAPILMNTTIMPAAGNHDAGNSTFIDHFNLDSGSQKTTTGVYYSVDYSNAHFVILNTNESSGSYAEFTQIQLDWMKTDIGAAKANGAKWIIVVMHKGPYTTAEHAKDADIIDTRKNIAPLFSQLGVDLVLQGHDHVYERSKPISNGSAGVEGLMKQVCGGVAVDYIKDPTGTIYITPGTAGTKHYHQDASLSQQYLNLFDVANGPFKDTPDINNQETFLSVTIDGGTLTATVYQTSKNVDNSVPYVIDQFGIIKNT